MRTIEQVWGRISSHAGETFRQIRGGEFTYDVSGDYVRLHRTNRSIPRKNFEEALRYYPLKNTAPVQHLQGPSYVYAILMDERITGSP
jgi:hypothetical protein